METSEFSGAPAGDDPRPTTDYGFVATEPPEPTSVPEDSTPDPLTDSFSDVVSDSGLDSSTDTGHGQPRAQQPRNRQHRADDLCARRL